MTKVISLDIGTGFVKACSDAKKVQFPALYAHREAGEWENQKERIEGTGIEAVRISEYPKSVVMRPVMEGVPSNKKALIAVVNEAIARLDISLWFVFQSCSIHQKLKMSFVLIRLFFYIR